MFMFIDCFSVSMFYIMYLQKSMKFRYEKLFNLSKNNKNNQIINKRAHRTVITPLEAMYEAM